MTAAATSEPADLPAPVERFAELVRGDGEPRTMLVEARGRFRRRPLPWLPIRTRAFVALGADRVMDIDVRVAKIHVLSGLDTYVDGRGLTRVGRRATIGPETDQGAFHTVVVETLAFPGAWGNAGFDWEPVDARSARLRVPFGDGVEIATVGFDPATGFPIAYDVPRFKGPGAPKVGWHVDMGEWRAFGRVWSATSVAATWADEPGAWYRSRVERIVPDIDMTDALARARDAYERARRDRA
jgi:hypothetical protein